MLPYFYMETMVQTSNNRLRRYSGGGLGSPFETKIRTIMAVVMHYNPSLCIWIHTDVQTSLMLPHIGNPFIGHLWSVHHFFEHRCSPFCSCVIKTSYTRGLEIDVVILAIVLILRQKQDAQQRELPKKIAASTHLYLVQYAIIAIQQELISHTHLSTHICWSLTTMKQSRRFSRLSIMISEMAMRSIGSQL